MNMDTAKTAIILIGYQNDYFAEDGVLHSVIEESLNANNVLMNTISFLSNLQSSNVLIVSTPICFVNDYEELPNPVGILKVVKEVGAFKEGTIGAETIPEIKSFGDKVIEITGKKGLDAFSNTALDELLCQHEIKNIVIAGVVSSVCIDSTGRSAHAKGYDVSILSDCTAGRASYEQTFYCDEIFPIYAEVTDSHSMLSRLTE